MSDEPNDINENAVLVFCWAFVIGVALWAFYERYGRWALSRWF